MIQEQITGYLFCYSCPSDPKIAYVLSKEKVYLSTVFTFCPHCGKQLFADPPVAPNHLTFAPGIDPITQKYIA